MTDKITQTFEITAAPHVMERFERFLALLHHNSRFGHSGLFAMPLDGDGADTVEVSPKPRYGHEVDLCGSIGGGVEIAHDNCYSALNTRPLTHSYVVKTGGVLYKDGKQLKAVPSTER